MHLFTHIKNSLLSTKKQLGTNSLDSLLWLVNVVPSIAGFSMRGDKIKAPFWFLHIPLLCYVYGVGCFVYQWKHAQNTGDVIRNYFNISLLILVAINSWWWLWERSLLKAILKDIDNSDRMSRSSSVFKTQHEKMMKTIKIIIFIFYGSSIADAFIIYLPDRVDILGSHSTLTMAPCVGMEPLTASPNREICLTLIVVQEFTIMTVTLNFQALLLLLIAHTACMYKILSYEIMELNANENIEEKQVLAREVLPVLAVYCCGWENFELKEKKMVLGMLRQAQKPIQLLAANLIPVNIYTFGSTLEGIYKFVTVVKF